VRPAALERVTSAATHRYSIADANGRGVYVVGLRHIRLCFAAEWSNCFLLLMRGQLAWPAEFDAATHPIDCGFTSRTLFQ